MSKLLYTLIKTAAIMIAGIMLYLCNIAKVPLERLSTVPSMKLYTEEQIDEIKGDAYNRGYNNGVAFTKASYEEKSSTTYPSSYDSESSDDNDYQEYAVEEDPTVYYTQYGECYHIDYDCHYIRGHEIYSGPWSKAKQHLRPCSNCAYRTDWD